MNVAACDVMHFSTDALPERDRIAIWREVFGRHVIRLQVEPLAEGDFSQTALVRSLPGLSLMSTKSSGFRAERTRPLIVDGNDDFILTIITEGFVGASQLGRDATIRPFDGFLMSSSDAGAVHYPVQTKRISLALKRGAVASVVREPEAAIARRLPRETLALRLLTRYVTLPDDCVLASPDLRHAFATHVYDLVALVLGATRDGTELAQGRGLRAARLGAIKADIANGIGNGEALSVAEIAGRHRVTPRYVQMLFAAEGSTFSEYVIEQRLTRAYRMLADVAFADRTIGAIAFEVGFANLSHFNRVFRRRYGATPSDVRATAKRGEHG
jgi:AraC-like DNA-binding protein